MPGESLWVHSNGVNGKPTFHRRANLSWFSEICNHLGEIAAGSRKSLTLINPRWRFFLGKKTPYGQIFTNVFKSPNSAHGNTSFCANFVKFGRPEVGEIARYLMDKKTKFRLALPLPLLRGSRPKVVRDSSNNILEAPQISSKSVHFRRSYSRTREHRSNAPQSLYNTRQSLSFFAE